jgi:hypothetical protein
VQAWNPQMHPYLACQLQQIKLLFIYIYCLLQSSHVYGIYRLGKHTHDDDDDDDDDDLKENQ